MTGKELRAIRKRLGLSQEELAGLIGISQHMISSWENGVYSIKRKTEDKIREIANLPPLPPLPPVMSGKEFRALRIAAGLTQFQLQKVIKSSNYFISRVECGSQAVPDKVGAQMRQLFGHLLKPASPRAPHKPSPLCARCLCWIAKTGLPCGCPGGRPETNGAHFSQRGVDIASKAV